MKSRNLLKILLSVFVLFSLVSPSVVLAAGEGKKYFKIGMKHEAAEEWDKAVEAFTIAVADNPKNPEYRLHLRRALFNASQQYMKLGRTAADEKDYVTAYTYFRKAYAFDPVNELARSEMARMVRLQEELKGGPKKDETDPRIVPTSGTAADGFRIPQKLETLRDLPFPSGIGLQQIIKDLSRALDLNVLFDVESRLENRQVRIDLKQVTAAKALDYIFLQENLFFQRVGPRTILVASGQRRQIFQQLVLRTFYLANASPKDVKTVIQTAIPPQPGRSQTIVLEDAATNSVTVRDTEENVRLIGRLINSLDKDRAEVVMDVAIYEVSKSDLLRLGNQIGNETQLTTLGGTTRGVVGLGGNDLFGTIGRAAADVIPSVFGVGIALPAANLIAFQSQGNTKLLASTQIHAFNNEDSSARIGQRVPVRTASFAPVGGTTPNPNNNFVGDVINYEQVGLTLKFKPIVFPNHDVQVAMEIESKDVVAGGTDNNPVFSERSIKGTARVQNNRTLLLASVAQDVESQGRSGIPFLGLIPILGRLFTAPTRDNRQVDIVIAVTPRVIRAPAILPEDEVERPTGSIGVPTNSSLEAMVIEEERNEYLATIRRIPNNSNVQLPDQANTEPTYVRTDAVSSAAVTSPPQRSEPATADGAPLLRPIDASVKALNFTQTSDAVKPVEPEKTVMPTAETTQPTAALVADLQLPAVMPELKAGEKAKIAIMVNSSAEFRSALLGLKFDAEKLAIRSVAFGDVFGPALANNPVAPFLNQNGKMFVSLAMPSGTAQNMTGILAFIEIEALVDGKAQIDLEKDALNLLNSEGKNIAIRF